ncbi:hypothetical protein SAMN05444972_103192 [Marininema halotolerans]|uniref:Uncharacterized protein n=1 Tax=Marininema halotolerans TaxID=1155944 RepID=A0A1I6QJZ6_9BACL|nr:hypothetical protein SAMN05444972_103192 [Marininema halotolerans]
MMFRYKYDMDMVLVRTEMNIGGEQSILMLGRDEEIRRFLVRYLPLKLRRRGLGDRHEPVVFTQYNFPSEAGITNKFTYKRST